MLIEFEGKRPKIGKNVFIAPNAYLVGDVEVDDDSSIWFGAVIRGDFGPVRIGKRCSIQDNATLHVFESAPTILRDEVTVGHNAVLEGCELLASSLVGMNATVLPFARIGERTMVAAGSVVTERSIFPDRVLVGGAPARVLKELDGSALGWIERASRDYCDMQKRYRAQGLG